MVSMDRGGPAVGTNEPLFCCGNWRGFLLYSRNNVSPGRQCYGLTVVVVSTISLQYVSS